MMNELARELNKCLESDGSHLLSMLSERGRRAYFPFGGILGQSAEAKGSEINATIGMAFEDDGSPMLLESLKDMVDASPQSFLYAPSFGNPELRRRWREMMIRKNPSLEGRSFSQPVATSALTHALYVAGQLFVDKGDEVLVSDLYWDNYELIFEDGLGGCLKLFETFSHGGFNVEGLRRQLMSSGDKKIVILNFPNNPTGYTVTDGEALALRNAFLEAAEAGKKVVALLDDAYFGLVYEEGVYKESMFSLLANLHPNVLAVKLDGPTKEDYVWGMRLGFITYGCGGASDEQYTALECKAAGIVRMTLSNANNIGQHLLLQTYNHADYESEKQHKYETLKARYLEIKRILGRNPQYQESFVAKPFNSGYFMCVEPRGVDPNQVRRLLLEEHATGVIMLSGMIRMAFSSVPLDRLAKLFENIDAVVRRLKSEN